jgi:hypothetical protein
MICFEYLQNPNIDLFQDWDDSGRRVLMSGDLRKLKRFEAGEGAFAALIRPEQPIVVGKIIDFSSGGLGIRYLAAEEIGQGPSLVQIFGSGMTRIDRIKSTVIHDSEISEESSISLSVRRCGIKFEQRCRSSELHKFINSTFVGGAGKRQSRNGMSKNKVNCIGLGG